MLTSPDPVELTVALIRCPSVTPEHGGAFDLLTTKLEASGFACTRVDRGEVKNLYARWGTTSPVMAFAGHVDVVPVGDVAAWSQPPFSGHQEDGIIWGRGAVDMKSGVAAFVSAAIRFAAEHQGDGSVALLITGDEEGPSIDGTVALLDWMAEVGEQADFCVVGEPTSLERFGDTIKIGRRGSMTGSLTIRGRQGHTAYPERAENPLPVLARVCTALAETPLDFGTTHFQPSTLALSSIDVGNLASNVIPAEGRAVFNIRFNDAHSSESLKIWAQQLIAAAIDGTDCTAEITWRVSGESFLTSPGPLVDIVAQAITDRVLETPALTTGGGTSDARFIKSHCPVVEFGLVGDTMHQVDERVPERDIRALAEVYGDILKRFFG